MKCNNVETIILCAGYCKNYALLHNSLKRTILLTYYSLADAKTTNLYVKTINQKWLSIYVCENTKV